MEVIEVKLVVLLVCLTLAKREGVASLYPQEPIPNIHFACRYLEQQTITTVRMAIDRNLVESRMSTIQDRPSRDPFNFTMVYSILYSTEIREVRGVEEND